METDVCRSFEQNIFTKLFEITVRDYTSLGLGLDEFHSVYKCLKDLNREINENKESLDGIRVHCSNEEKINFIKQFIEDFNNTDYGQILEENDPENDNEYYYFEKSKKLYNFIINKI